MVLKMTLEYASTEALLYAKYRYEHCDGDCESCPCKDVQYRCSYIYEETKKELNLRDE